LDIDIRAEHGLALIPHSETDEGRYEWLAEGLDAIAGLADLPKAKIGWTRERQRRRIRSAITPEHCEPGTLLYRGRRYVDRFEPSISGQNGHTACFVAALKIVSFVRNLGGTEADAWALLNYFNATKCEPEWSEKELLHKWHDALLKAK
jgi:hypothetical protein